jgi:membrane protein implicated in regulation of membrane protease activity
MLEYINNNLSGFWIALGFALLAAEVLLFGFTTIIFLFAGLGALTTGLLMEVEILPLTWTAGTACFGIATGLSSAILWKPLRKLQEAATPQTRQKSDIVGYEFVLTEDITRTRTGSHRYSGVDWKVEIDSGSEDDVLAKGDRVVVVSVDVGLFRVKRMT